MQDSLGTLAAVFGVTSVASLMQSVTGFGYGIVAIPLLSLFLPIGTSSVLLALSSFTLNLYLALRLRRHIDLRGVVPVMIAVAAGVPIGLLFLTSVDEAILARALGGFLLAYVAWSIATRKKPSRSLHPIAAGVPLGLASGALSGAFAMGGPPLVAYVSSMRLKHLRHVVTIQLLLGMSGAVRIVGIAVSGLLSRDILVLASVALLGAVAGASLVIATELKLAQQTLRTVILLVIGAAAAKYLVIG